jgi:polyisoprenoid-binding protein YceI
MKWEIFSAGRRSELRQRRMIMQSIPVLGYVSVLLASTLAHAGGSDFRFDTVHTQVFFSVSHLGFSHSTGRMRVKSGFIHFDADDWPASKVDATIDAAALDMGDAGWSDKVRSYQFLETEKYPTLHFVSTKVEKTGERSGIVHGTLSMLGLSRNVDLNVTFNRAGADPYTLIYTIGFSASATLKRSDFGMKRYATEIGDEISIRIEAEGLRDGDAQKQTPDGETKGS